MAEDWHWEDVKAAIRKRGLTLSELSVRIGFSRAAVRQIKCSSFPNAQAGVAAFLGLTPQQIWPSRYDPTGMPVRRTRRSTKRHDTARNSEIEPQKTEAA